MGRVTFACVRVGTKYSEDYVQRLKRMIALHYPGDFNFRCITDVEAQGLTKWWAKLVLFSPQARGDMRTVYLDLDTVIVGDLSPIVQWDGDFAVCENFTRLAGHSTWPCAYGSCAMSFAPGWGQPVFDEFMAHKDALMQDAWRYGDQMVIEKLVPNATLLQSVLPPGFFLNKRDLPKYPDAPPPEASIVVFGGAERPDNCKTKWVQEAWN